MLSGQKGKVTILIGGAWGSEGKGKIAHVMANEYNTHVRTGAPNAGHTLYHNKKKYVFQTIPCGSVNLNARMVIGAGGMIIEDILKRELAMIAEFDDKIYERLYIHPNAVIIEPKHVLAEYGQKEPCEFAHKPMECPPWQEIKKGLPEIVDPCTKCDKLGSGDLWKLIGSTREGCGAALVDKIWRGASPRGSVRLAKDTAWLEGYITDTTIMINEAIDRGENVFIEGTQGSGLSLHHGTYPKTTSRDTNAGGWCSEAGVSPLAITDVVAVFRPYPIRVAGDSGPTGSAELTWADVEQRAGAPIGSLKEITTVTKRVRRVFEFAHEWFAKMVMINRPTALALCFADYLSTKDAGVNKRELLSKETLTFVDMIEDTYNVPVKWVSTGPMLEDTVTM